MPAPKRDLDTIHGRLQFARDKAGYTRVEFARLMGYSSDGWAKIELGTNSLQADTLSKANEVLQLDERYYFGKVPYDEAAGSSAATLTDLSKKIETMAARLEGSKNDEASMIANRIRGNERLRDLFDLVKFWEGSMLQRFTDMAFAYIQGRRDIDEKGEASSRKEA